MSSDAGALLRELEPALGSVVTTLLVEGVGELRCDRRKARRVMHPLEGFAALREDTLGCSRIT